MSDPGAWTADDEVPTRTFASGTGKDALTSSLRAVQSTLRELCEHERLLGTGALTEAQKTLDEVDQRLSREQLTVVVVGERGSGKSTLLGAIVGDRLLGGARGQSAKELFPLLRRERALIVGARAGEALRRCIASFVDAEANAERSYRERIATLEKERTPEPDVFKQQLLAEAEPAVEAAAHEAVARARLALEGGFSLLEKLCLQECDACGGGDALLALAERFDRELPERVTALRRNARS